MEKQYMIDKVVRMRAMQGRFGVDHSEILNYEFEMANKARDDHMNMLVYKTMGSTNRSNTKDNYDDWNKENAGRMTSAALFNRLSQKEIATDKKQLPKRLSSA